MYIFAACALEVTRLRAEPCSGADPFSMLADAQNIHVFDWNVWPRRGFVPTRMYSGH